MSEWKLDGEVGRDGRLMLELPENIPAGPVHVTIKSVDDDETAIPIRDELRRLLAEAGMLDTDFSTIEENARISARELAALSERLRGDPPGHVLVDQDRGPR